MEEIELARARGCLLVFTAFLFGCFYPRLISIAEGLDMTLLHGARRDFLYLALASPLVWFALTLYMVPWRKARDAMTRLAMVLAGDIIAFLAGIFAFIILGFIFGFPEVYINLA